MISIESSTHSYFPKDISISSQRDEISSDSISIPRAQLSAPKQCSELFVLKAIVKMEIVGAKMNEVYSRELETLYQKYLKLNAENAQKLKESAEKAQSLTLWSLIKRVAAYVVAAFSMIFGVAVATTQAGVVIGGAMIASGLLSITNLAMQETGVWDFVAKKLAKDNEDRARHLAIAFPTIVGLSTGAIGLYGTFSAMSLGTLNLMQQGISAVKTAATCADGVATIGKGSAEAQLLFKEIDIQQLEKKFTDHQFELEDHFHRIERLMHQETEVHTQAGNFVKMLVHSNKKITRV